MKQTKQIASLYKNWMSYQFLQNSSRDVVLNLLISTRDSFKPQSLLHSFLFVKESKIGSLSPPPNRLDIDALIELSNDGDDEYWEQLFDRFSACAYFARFVYQVRNPEMLESYLPILGDRSFECTITHEVPSIDLTENDSSSHIANWFVTGAKVFDVLSELQIESLEELQIRIMNFKNAHAQFKKLAEIMSNHCKKLEAPHPNLRYKDLSFFKEISPESEKSLFFDYAKRVSEDGY